MVSEKRQVQLLSPTRIRELLRAHDKRTSRALGQHFLADPNLARHIAQLADVHEGDPVLEIGPGIGSLTLALAETGADLTLLEVDRHAIPILRDVLSEADVTYRLLEGDALQMDLQAELDPKLPWVMISNLPYNIATPLVMRILEEYPFIKRLFVMVQKEVGQRWVAQPGESAYGFPSVKLAYFASAKLVDSVPPSVFYPPPKVDSVLVSLQRFEQPPVTVADPNALFSLARAGFQKRRKMLRQSLRSVLGDNTEQVLVAADVAPTARAQELDLSAWARIVAKSSEATSSQRRLGST